LAAFFSLLVSLAFFGAVVLSNVGFDALLDAAADSWIRRVVKNVRRVATDEIKTDEDKTLVRSAGSLNMMRRATSILRKLRKKKQRRRERG
jgi:hypothetical protein